MQKRDGRLVALDAKGNLNGKTPAAVKLEQQGGARLIKAEALDAGAAFRLVGFYPSVEGGEATLQVNLDAGTAGAMSGTLWARDFTVVGDSVVNDVLTDPHSTAVLGDGKTAKAADASESASNNCARLLSVGGGKFRLHGRLYERALLGATMRGTADFKAQHRRSRRHLCPALRPELRLPARSPFSVRVSVGRQGRGWSALPSPSKASSTTPPCWSIRCR